MKYEFAHVGGPGLLIAYGVIDSVAVLQEGAYVVQELDPSEQACAVHRGQLGTALPVTGALLIGVCADDCETGK